MAFDSNLLLALHLLLVAMTAVMFTNWHFNRDIRGLKEWLFGFLAAIANVSLFLWNQRQIEIGWVLGNQVTLLATGYFALKGSCRHMDVRFPVDLVVVPLMLSVLGAAAYFTLVVDEIALRFLTSSVVSGGLCVAAGLILARGGFREYPLRNLFGWTLVVHGIFNAVRSGLFVPQLQSLLLSIPLLPTNLILYEQIVLTSLLALGTVLLTNEVISRRLRTQAERDALTGLYNRRKFLELLAAAKSLAARSGMPLSLLVVDIDHFKSINDNHGHVAGDQVLAGFSMLIQESLRKEDVMGRLGGEEFAIYLPNTSLDAAVALAERLRSRAESMQVVTDKAKVSVTISIGLTEMGAKDSIEQAIELADSALYEAKRCGRNRSVSRRHSVG